MNNNQQQNGQQPINGQQQTPAQQQGSNTQQQNGGNTQQQQQPQIPKGAGTECYISPNATIGQMLPPVDKSDPYACIAGFYCPYIKKDVPASLPVLCPATINCQMSRLAGFACASQGKYEPVICPAGSYCPTTDSIVTCPAGSYCLTGSTKPLDCPILSNCPSGSTTPQSYGGLLLCIVIDVIILLIAVVLKLRQLKKADQSYLNIIPFYSRFAAKNLTYKQVLKKFNNEAKQFHKAQQQRNPPPRYQQYHDSPTPSSQGTEGSFVIAGLESFDSFYDNEYLPRNASPIILPMEVRNRSSSSPRKFIGGVVTPPLRNTSIPHTHHLDADRNAAKRRSQHELQRFAGYYKKGLDNKNLSMNFKFNDLGLQLKGGKEILKGVNGEINAGRMTAIMGPSGAGKTTFMNVLMGKVTGTKGQLDVNGMKDIKLSTYRKVIGYVPQEDIMLKELTVRENIMHSANCRLSSNWSTREVERFVDSIIEALNLTHVANSVIGDETERGVSGGQRKRVNIAMELASVPLALFLDEPTSGLDSTAALQVAQILSMISRLGLTVVSVIHQPRVEIFEKFDDVLLIVPGGETAYFGPVERIQEYFQELGYMFNAQTNPADVLMDILSGKGRTVNGDVFNTTQLVQFWKQKSQFYQIPIRLTKEQENSFHFEVGRIIKSRGANFISQTIFCLSRAMTQQFRRVSSLFLEIFVGTFAGVIMGFSVQGFDELYKGVWVFPYSLMSPAPVEWMLPIYSLLIGIAVALAAAPAGVNVYGEEKSVFWREASSGHNTLSYYVGKFLGSLPRIAIASLHFTSLFHFLAQPVISFQMQYAAILLQFFGVYGLAAIISMLVRRENTTLLAVVCCLFAAVFCGVGPTLDKAKGWGILFIWEMSFNKWAVEAQFSEYVQPYVGVYETKMSAANYGYTLNQVNKDFLMCLIIGIVQRIIAYFLMIGLNRSKQK